MNQITVELSDFEAKCLASLLLRVDTLQFSSTPYVLQSSKAAIAAVLHELDDVLAGVSIEN